MTEQHGRVVDGSWTGTRTGEIRANTGNGRVGRIGRVGSSVGQLLDEISTYWSQFIVSTTPHAVEILTLTAAASHLLNIPDPEGEEAKAAAAHAGKVRQIKSGPGTRAEKEAEIQALGDPPRIPEDPRLKPIGDPLGLFFFPIIAINAPVEGCGKSNTAKALKHLSRRVELEQGSTYAAVRDTKSYGYGVILDEAQRTFRRGSDTQYEWEQLLNSSFELGAAMPKKMVPVGPAQVPTPKKFPQFGMLALAGIGLRLPGDNASRVIWINLHKVDMSQVAAWEERKHPQVFAQYGRRLSETFTPLMGAAYEHNEPMPTEVRGRLGDKWKPLIITADLAGGRWPTLARQIAVNSISIELSGRPEQVDEQAKAYADIKEVWPESEDRIRSVELIDRLKSHDVETYGWIRSVDDGGGKQLASLLRSSDFKSPRSRSSGNWRGWYRREFEHGWAHYNRLLEVPVQTVQPVQSQSPVGDSPVHLPVHDPSTRPSTEGELFEELNQRFHDAKGGDQ